MTGIVLDSWFIAKLEILGFFENSSGQWICRDSSKVIGIFVTNRGVSRGLGFG